MSDGAADAVTGGAPDRRAELSEALSADGRQHPEQSRIALVCARCVAELDVSGTGATVLTHPADGDRTSTRRGLVEATNEVSTGLEDLQLVVGEGPCLEAFSSGGPVLVPDLDEESQRWPAFTPGAQRCGAQAVFSFPLQIGALRLGSLDCYRDTRGPLAHAKLQDALILADFATHAILTELDGHDTEDLQWLADPHAEVHQATGMVQVQLGSSTEAALLRLRAHAYTAELTLAETARRVVARELRFQPDVATD